MHDSVSARQYDDAETPMTAHQTVTTPQDGIEGFLINRPEYKQIKRDIDEITGVSFGLVCYVLTDLQRPLSGDPSRALTDRLGALGINSKTAKSVMKVLTRASNGGLWSALQKELQTP